MGLYLVAVNVSPVCRSLVSSVRLDSKTITLLKEAYDRLANVVKSGIDNAATGEEQVRIIHGYINIGLSSMIADIGLLLYGRCRVILDRETCAKIALAALYCAVETGFSMLEAVVKEVEARLDDSKPVSQDSLRRALKEVLEGAQLWPEGVEG